MMKKVSVIIPIYKVEKYLRRCVESVLRQDYKNLEIILVDDGSPDNCGEICDAYASTTNNVIVIHKENGGLSSARNAGLDVATGDFITFVDSDDWLEEYCITHMIDLQKKYDADIVSVSYRLTKTENTQQDRSRPQIVVLNRDDALVDYMYQGMAHRISEYPAWKKLYRKSLFNSLRFPEGQLYEDAIINIELIQESSIYVKSSRICYNYFQGGSSIIRSKMKAQDLHDSSLVGNQFVEISKKEHNKFYILAKQYQARNYFAMLLKSVIFGVDDSISDKCSVLRQLHDNLRKNYWLLIKSPMPINRKIIMTILAMNYQIPFAIFEKLRKVKGKK